MTGTQTKENKAKKNAKKVVAREARRVMKDQVRNMELTRTRNSNAKKVLNNSIVKQLKPRINWYLIELLDPSRWEDAIAHGLRGIPDFYAHRNHVFCTRTVLQLGPADFGPDGKSNIIVKPTLDDHLGHNNPLTTRTTYVLGQGTSVGSGFVFRDRNTTGNGGYSGWAAPTPQYSAVTNGSRLTVYLPSSLECASSVGAASSCRRLYPKKNSSTVTDNNFGDYKYTILPAADNVINMAVWFEIKYTGNVTLEVETDLGTRVLTVALASDTTASFSLTLNAADSEIRSIKFLNSTGGTLNLDSLSTYCHIHPTVSYTNMLYGQAQNYDRIKEDFTSVRPVAGYLWVKYRGDLTKSGNLTGALIDAGSTPTLARATDYDDVAGLLHSYEGNATEGGYGIWCPMNPADNNFTPIQESRPLAPYLMCCLDVDDVAAQNFRVESYFIWEGLTQLQMYSPEPGSVDIEMMNDAFAKLAHFDKFMCNDSHLSTIARFLSNGFKRGATVMKEYASTPQGKQSLMTAANFLLSKARDYGPVVANAARIALQAAASV